MIERIVENWLTSANERGYQIPFSHVLMLEGHTVLYVSKHGPMEQSKDIITIGPDSVPCAYQLKAGNINLETWRRIEAQIHELVEVPIIHPSIDKEAPFRAYLVTNGDMEDTVRRQIDDRNSSWRTKRLPTINIIAKGDLLRKFADVYESLLPETPESLRDYLEVYLADGRDFVNKDRLAQFCDTLLLKDSSPVVDNVNKLGRRIASAAVVMQSLLATFEREKNHVAILESWVMFCGYVLALADRAAIPEKLWRPTYDIVVQRISEQLDDLKEEFLSRTNYIEQPSLGDGGVVYKARLTIVLGWLCAYELYHLASSPTKREPDKALLGIAQQRFEEWSWYWGESGTPHQLMVSLLAEIGGSEEFSWKILLNLLAEICERNASEDTESGFPNPYVPVDEVVEAQMPDEQLSLDMKQFSGFSYHLAPLVYQATRRGKRVALNELWKRVSRIVVREYEPTHKWHYLLWRSDLGKERVWSFERTQSWSKLKELATKRTDTLPTRVAENPEFLYYFSLVYPHRLTSEALRVMHEKAASSAKA